MGEVFSAAVSIAAIAASFIPGVGPFIAAGLAAIGIVGGLLFAQKPKSPKVDLPSTARDRIQNIRSSTDSHVVVYGTARVAARPWVFAESNLSDDRLLHLVGPVAGHEVEDITHVLFDDDLLAYGTDIDESTSIVGAVAGTRFDIAGRALVFKHLGADDQDANSTAVAALSNWTSAHRGRGIAYIYIQLSYDKTAYQNGVPKISAIVQGRKVWDPRDGDQSFDDPSTHIFSNNWALCVLDYLTNASFGLGAKLDEIDTASFIAAANVSDELVETGSDSPSEFQVRYTCDGVIDTADDPLDIMERLLSGGAGALSYSQGKYHLFAGAFVTPTRTLTADDLAGELEVQPKLPRAQLFNAVRGTFVNPDDNYQPTDFPPRTNSLYETQDGGFQIFRDIELPFTQDNIRAQRIAELVLRKSRQGITVKFPAKLTALNLAVFDTVRLTLNETGADLGWDGKVFRVLGMEFSEGLQDGVLLTLQEDDASSYEWDGGQVLSFDPAPDTILPNPFDIPAPTNVSFESGDAQLFVAGDGTVRPRVKIAWSAPQNVFVTQGGEIEIQYRDSALGGNPLDWGDGNTQTKLVRGELTVAHLTDVEDGATYDIRLRSRTRIGAVSDGDDADWQRTFQHVVVGKTAKPTTPDTFTVARLADGTRRFSWTHPDAPLDLKGYRIKWFSGTPSDWDAMTRLHPTGVLTESPYETNELAAGTYSFAIKAVDTSDNESEDALFIQATLGNPRLREALAQRLEHDLGWPGTVTNGRVDNKNILRSDQAGSWDSLTDPWDSYTESWEDLLPHKDPLIYETPEIDLSIAATFTPLITPEGIGNATIEMRTGGGGSPQIDTAYRPLETVTARFVQFRIQMSSGVSPQTKTSIEQLTIILDGETLIEEFEDLDTSGADTEVFERIAAGHFRIAPRDLVAITFADIVLQNVGPGFTKELISKSAAAFGSPGRLAAEFKIYNGSGVLADATIDAQLKGPKTP